MSGRAATGDLPYLWKRNLAIFMTAAMVEAALYGQLIAFTPLYLPELGVSGSEVSYFTGLIASVTMFIVIPALSRWGYLTDRLTDKTVIVRSFLLHAVVAVMAIAAGNVWVFLFGRAISLLTLNTSGLMLRHAEHSGLAERSSLALAALVLAPQLGAFCGPLLGGFVMEAIGFRALIGVNLVLTLLVTLAFNRFITTLGQSGNSRSFLQLMKFSLGVVLRWPRLSLLYLTLTLLVAGWMLTFSYLPLEVQRVAVVDRPAATTGLVIGLGGLAGILVSAGLTRLSRRAGDWPILAGVVAFGALLPLLSARAWLPSQLAATWMLVSGCAATAFNLLQRVIVRSSLQVDPKLVLSLAVLPVNGGMILGPVIGSYLNQSPQQHFLPAGMLINLLGLAVLLLASRLNIPSEGMVAG